MADYFQGGEMLLEAVIAFYIASQVEAVEEAYVKIANQQYVNYFNQRSFYFDTFQRQGEGPFVSEQFGIPWYIPDYVGNFNTGYFPPSAWYMFSPELVNRTQALGDSTQGYWMRYGARYSSIGAARLDNSSFGIDIASIYDDWNSYMNRYEEHKRDVFNERRWANRMGALSYGIKEAYEIAVGLATSFQVFDKAQGELVSEGNTMLNGLATFAGYRQMQSALDKSLGTDPNYATPFFLV